ncbi:MAG: hypothetical protein ACKPKO_63575 [Candidatus Fonsibacter sp.]
MFKYTTAQPHKAMTYLGGNLDSTGVSCINSTLGFLNEQTGLYLVVSF